MGMIANMAGKAVMRKKVNPKTGFSCRINPQPNFLVLGGTGPRAERIREDAFLKCAEDCQRNRWPILVLSGDAAMTNEILRMPNTRLLGSDISYDPFAGCADSLEAVRVLESLLPVITQQYGTNSGSYTGALAVARFLLDTMTESFGTDMLLLSNLDTVVRTVETQADVLSSLRWLEQNGYRVSESLQSELTKAWNNGTLTALSGIMTTLRRSLRFLTNQDQTIYSISELMNAGLIPVAEIPRAHGDRDAAVAAICAEMMNYIDRSGSFVLMDYEIPLPDSARELVNTAIFCIAVSSLRLMNTPNHLQPDDILPLCDTVVCLGMPDMKQAQQLTEFYASQHYTFMPAMGKEGLHWSPMNIETFSANHLMSGSYHQFRIEDGGAAVFDLNETVNFFRNIRI